MEPRKTGIPSPLTKPLITRHVTIIIWQEKLRGYMLLKPNQKLKCKRIDIFRLPHPCVRSPIAGSVLKKREGRRGRIKNWRKFPDTPKIEVCQANLRYHRVWALE